MINLENDKVKGFDNYPKNISEAYDLLIRYRTPRRVPFNRHGNAENVTFVNTRQAMDKSKIQCYSCSEMGHYANECPKKKGRVGNAVQAVTFGEMQRIDEDDIHIGDFSYLQYEDRTDEDTADTEPTSLNDDTFNDNETQEEEKIPEEHEEETASEEKDDEESIVYPDDEEGEKSDPGYSDSSDEGENLTGPYYATGALLKKVNIPDKFDNRRIYSFGSMLVIQLQSGVLYHVGDLNPPPSDPEPSEVTLCMKPEVYQKENLLIHIGSSLTVSQLSTCSAMKICYEIFGNQGIPCACVAQEASKQPTSLGTYQDMEKFGIKRAELRISYYWLESVPFTK